MINERLIHSIKTVIAVIIGFLFMRIIQSPHSQWIIISILVVMCAQIYVGSVLQKSYLRFLGTLFGCILAVIVIEVFQASWWSILLVLMVAGFVFSYVATAGNETLSYFSTMGGVTLTLILLGQPNPSLDFATARFLEITLGIFIATVVSQFVFPIHAKTHLQKTQAKTLQQLKEFYHIALVSQDMSQMQTAESHDLDEAIVKSLLKQRQLAKESQREYLGKSFDLNHFEHSLFCERQILRAVNFMQVAQSKLADTSLPRSLEDFHLQVLAALAAMADHILQNTEKPIILPDVDAIKKLPFDDPQNSETLMNWYVLIFNAEMIVSNIAELADLYKI